MKKIALISDIHFGELARTREFAVPGYPVKGETTGEVSLTDSLVEKLRSEGVEYLFISGDLTSRATPQEFRYCIEKIKEIVSRAEIPENNIVWAIGNHDIDWKITEIFEKYTEELKTNKDLLQFVEDCYRLSAIASTEIKTKALPNPSTAGDLPLSGIYETDEFIVFILNSALYSTHNQTIKHGKLSTKQLDWFREHAKKLKDDSRWKIVLMHHHPHTYPFPTITHDITAIEDGPEFMEIAGDVGIHLILHGHRHHPKAITQDETGWSHPITLICAGSLAVNSDERKDIPNTFHVIELTDVVGTCKLHSYEYSASEGWKQIQARKEAPLDYEMYFGKNFNKAQIESEARRLWDSHAIGKPIKVSELPEALKFCSHEKIEDVLEKTKPSKASGTTFNWKTGRIHLYREDEENETEL